MTLNGADFKGKQIPLPFAINGTTTYEEEVPKELRK